MENGIVITMHEHEFQCARLKYIFIYNVLNTTCCTEWGRKYVPWAVSYMKFFNGNPSGFTMHTYHKIKWQIKP